MKQPKTTKCPSCWTIIEGAPPVVCPNSNLGIPASKGRVQRDPFNPLNGFTGSEVMDRTGMPLDEFVRRLGGKSSSDE